MNPIIDHIIRWLDYTVSRPPVIGAEGAAITIIESQERNP